MRRFAVLTDKLEHLWEEVIMKRVAGSVLVVAYLFMIIIVEFNRQGWLPAPWDARLPTNHFFAVEVAFTLLLLTEVVSLVFGLTRSFSRSIGTQIEILSLILLRDAFKKFTGFSEPLEWDAVSDSIGAMAADAGGALAIFIILAIYYRIQRSRPITRDEVEQAAFVDYKKLIALGLLVIFVAIGLVDIYRYLVDLETYPFFESFYTVLIFSDVLMVLLSLRYSYSFNVTFRNFCYAIVTVFIRLALIAPDYINVLMGIGAALFALGVAYTYNNYGGDILAKTEEEVEQQSQTAPQVGD